MGEIPNNEGEKRGLVAIRSTKSAKISQRRAMHTILSSDEEYSDMEAFFPLPTETVSGIDEKVSAETGIESVSNVMNLLYADIQGYGSRFIASKMGLTLNQVHRIRQSSAYLGVREALLKEILSTSRRIMEVSAVKAVKTLTECMDSSNEKVRLNAATEVLDRIGLNTTQKVEVTASAGDMSGFTDDELAEILRQSMPNAGAIPVEAQEVGDIDDGSE